MRGYLAICSQGKIAADHRGRRLFLSAPFIAGGPMDLISTLLLTDTAVRIAMALLAGSFVLALVTLVRQVQRG